MSLTFPVEMPDATPEEEEDSQAPLDVTSSTKPGESESQGSVTVEGGRRRGRRRVMKKKKVKDEDGYLGKLTSSTFGLV
jgi:DNA polymerase delta subunit 3